MRFFHCFAALHCLLFAIMSQSISTGYIPRATPGDSLEKVAWGVGIWLLKVARRPGIRQGPGFCGKFKLCLTPYKCVLRRQFVFLVFNNFSGTSCIKVGLDVRISLVRVVSTGGKPPPLKKFFLKKLKAISNTDHILRRY